jgi:hypothetical protein
MVFWYRIKKALGNNEESQEIMDIQSQIELLRAKASLMPKKESGATNALNGAADTMQLMLAVVEAARPMNIGFISDEEMEALRTALAALEKSSDEKDVCPICGETDPDKHEAENLACEIANYHLSHKSDGD